MLVGLFRCFAGGFFSLEYARSKNAYREINYFLACFSTKTHNQKITAA